MRKRIVYVLCFTWQCLVANCYTDMGLYLSANMHMRLEIKNKRKTVVQHINPNCTQAHTKPKMTEMGNQRMSAIYNIFFTVHQLNENLDRQNHLLFFFSFVYLHVSWLCLLQKITVSKTHAKNKSVRIFFRSIKCLNIANGHTTQCI